MKNLIALLISGALFFCVSATLANDDTSGTGTVAETMNAGGYTYVRLENDSWVAAPTVNLAVGDEIQFAGGMLMKDFTSTTLDRTFESIRFAMSINVVGDEVAATATADPHANNPTANPHGTPKTINAPQAGEIAPLEGGKTIAEIQTAYTDLTDQQVSLRAQVMKVSLNILGKNWITLQDGTGTAPDNKLIATSSDVVATGDIVTVQGVAHTDVDLGAGYTYKVLIEEATFSK